ncbi:hypothetical protein [Allorhodopirellula heiligendammensis]|uniref:Uncharacterized protein n=1 Tax=Allorhodopirellula heiligendammensis TaxID=2714739 RepID=A0A5C6C467_9BACT|nr:hypothetical protein [Allorhodopirellula heiligendammensis]TWU18104.1 hypothetical protein Poly21_02590 [Allorhodopirellula heiligendammensis]
MAKFYVQSGTFRRVVAAESGIKAALWAVHEVMQQILPNEEERGAPSTESVTMLSARVRVDERGFDRHDAQELSTMEVMGQWTEMVMTLDRLQQMLDGNPPATPAARGRFSNTNFSDGPISDDLAA